MAKLGPFSYPDIRFADAVEIAQRIATKFHGTVSVKGLAWELGMAEGSGTLFAKVAALRDFGLVEGRGELRINGEIPDDVSLLVGLEEISRARRDEIVRRASLIQKHLTDAVRILGRKINSDKIEEYSENKQIINTLPVVPQVSNPGLADRIYLAVAGKTLEVPLTEAYLDVAISLLGTIRTELTDVLSGDFSGSAPQDNDYSDISEPITRNLAQQ